MRAQVKARLAPEVNFGSTQPTLPDLPGEIWARILPLANKGGKFARSIAHFSKNLMLASRLHEDHIKPEVPAAESEARRLASEQLHDDLFGSDSEYEDDYYFKNYYEKDERRAEVACAALMHFGRPLVFTTVG